MRFYAVFFLLLSQASLQANEKILEEGFASVLVSRDQIEAIYVKALENSLYPHYDAVGVNWEEAGKQILTAGFQVFEESKILFIADDSLDSMTEIAFEPVPKTRCVHLSRAECMEINEALISSQIQARAIDPPAFHVDLDE